MVKRNKIKIIVLAGPTSSGKSDMAISLARRFDGEIISADSRQVYRGMDIGTGKVTKKEQRMAKHWLLDIVSPKRQYTSALWRNAAVRVVKDITARGKMPIIAGGTGFYIDGLIYGTSFPEVEPDPKLRAKLEKRTTEQLFAELKKNDPRRARTIDRHNRVRLIRALEIILTTGKIIPAMKRNEDFDVLYMAIEVPMNKLSVRIEKRLDERMKRGLLTEVRRLHESGVSWKRMEELGLEYRWSARFLRKHISRKEMRDELLRAIIAYAKRQMTWWRKNKDVHWIKSQSEAYRLAKSFLKNGYSDPSGAADLYPTKTART